MSSGMTKHENIAKALKARLSELMTRVGEIDSELRKPLSADLEEQATDLENQGALEEDYFRINPCLRHGRPSQIFQRGNLAGVTPQVSILDKG
jgi:hypothetical protein